MIFYDENNNPISLKEYAELQHINFEWQVTADDCEQLSIEGMAVGQILSFDKEGRVSGCELGLPQEDRRYVAVLWGLPCKVVGTPVGNDKLAEIKDLLFLKAYNALTENGTKPLPKTNAQLYLNMTRRGWRMW